MFISKEEITDVLGSPSEKATERLRRTFHIPKKSLETLGSLTLSENWGNRSYALEKYLAVHLAWSIEQDAYTMSDNQLVVTAGHLQTRHGEPLYLVMERNNQPDKQPLYCVYVGPNPSATSLPTPPELPTPPAIPRGGEIVIAHEHILQKNSDRVPFLKGTPPVSQMCAVSGAIQWSLYRNLQLPSWYFGSMGYYLVPLYMQSRENITLAPDLIAPIQITPESMIVRTVLLPHMPYTNARVAVKRHDQLPHWMLDAWNKYATTLSEEQIDNPETA